MDLAKRLDHSAFIVLETVSERGKDPYLWIAAQMEWPHVNYKTVANDVMKIYQKYPMEKIGFDRSGVGDAAIELFDTVTLPFEAIVTSNPTKLDIISIIRGLIEHKRLKLDFNIGRKIIDQALIQERVISEAGNELYKHPAGTHDDLFWALGYACYVALPFVTGYVSPIIATSKIEQEPDIDRQISNMMGGNIDSIFGM